MMRFVGIFGAFFFFFVAYFLGAGGGEMYVVSSFVRFDVNFLCFFLKYVIFSGVGDEVISEYKFVIYY